jgi:hypothetical protein
VEKTQIRFSLHNQAAISKEYEKESEVQIKNKSEQIAIKDDTSGELKQQAPEELF